MASAASATIIRYANFHQKPQIEAEASFLLASGHPNINRNIFSTCWCHLWFGLDKHNFSPYILRSNWSYIQGSQGDNESGPILPQTVQNISSNWAEYFLKVGRILPKMAVPLLWQKHTLLFDGTQMTIQWILATLSNFALSSDPFSTFQNLTQPSLEENGRLQISGLHVREVNRTVEETLIWILGINECLL